MTAIVSLFILVFTFLFGWVYLALRWLGPLWSLAAISFLGGIFMVWLFGKVSNQDAIRKTRTRLSAELIGLRLFKDDLVVFFAIQYQILLWTMKYLRHSMIPMVIVMIPVIAILIQLNLHYARRPLGVGERTLVKVTVRDAESLGREMNVGLQAGEELEIETPGVRMPDAREVAWRVRGVAPGRFDLVVTTGNDAVAKKMAVGGRPEGVCSLRTGAHWLTNLLYPGEAPIPGPSAIESIQILYPELDISLFDWSMNWLILFFVLSLVFGFALKGALGVHIYPLSHPAATRNSPKRLD